jgi:hypothetical protein
MQENTISGGQILFDAGNSGMREQFDGTGT